MICFQKYFFFSGHHLANMDNMDILDIHVKEENISDNEENQIESGNVVIKEEVMLTGKKNIKIILKWKSEMQFIVFKKWYDL